MRLVLIVAALATLLMVLPAAHGLYWSFEWDPPLVDFDDADRQMVIAEHKMQTSCILEAQQPPVVALSVGSVRDGGPPVHYFLDGLEIFPTSPIELGEWNPEPGLAHVWTLERTLEIEVVRNPNVTVAFDAQQSWVHLRTGGGGADPCPLGQSVIHGALYDPAGSDYLGFVASALSAPEGDSETDLAEASLPTILVPLAALAAILACVRRGRNRDC